MESQDRGIDERSFQFACAAIDYVRTIKWEPGINQIIEQLVDASGSIAANRRESMSGSTTREFLRFNEISLRGAREAVLWLRICAAKKFGDHKQCEPLLDEAHQLVKILASIVLTTKQRLVREAEQRKTQRTKAKPTSDL